MTDAETPSFQDRMKAIREQRVAISSTPPDVLVDEAIRAINDPAFTAMMEEVAMLQAALPDTHPMKFHLNSLVRAYGANRDLIAQNIAQRPPPAEKTAEKTA